MLHCLQWWVLKLKVPLHAIVSGSLISRPSMVYFQYVMPTVERRSAVEWHSQHKEMISQDTRSVLISEVS